MKINFEFLSTGPVGGFQKNFVKFKRILVKIQATEKYVQIFHQNCSASISNFLEIIKFKRAPTIFFFKFNYLELKLYFARFFNIVGSEFTILTTFESCMVAYVLPL